MRRSSTRRESPQGGGRKSWVAQVLIAGVLGICLAGLLNATRAREYEPVASEWTGRPAFEQSQSSPARSYAELQVRPWRSGGREAGWSVDAKSLATAAPSRAVLEAERSSGPRTAAAVAARAELRAYDGAPPTVPHPVRQRSAAECLACHARGLAIGAALARPPSHPAYTSCTQCHVVSASPVPPESPAAQNAAARERNGFEGLASPDQGERAWPGAPPTIPHTMWMRQECHSCHGASARAGLRTTHPERRSCTQCHAPSAALDQRTARVAPR